MPKPHTHGKRVLLTHNDSHTHTKRVLLTHNDSHTRKTSFTNEFILLQKQIQYVLHIQRNIFFQLQTTLSVCVNRCA